MSIVVVSMFIAGFLIGFICGLLAHDEFNKPPDV